MAGAMSKPPGWTSHDPRPTKKSTKWRLGTETSWCYICKEAHTWLEHLAKVKS